MLVVVSGPSLIVVLTNDLIEAGLRVGIPDAGCPLVLPRRPDTYRALALVTPPGPRGTITDTQVEATGRGRPAESRRPSAICQRIPNAGDGYIPRRDIARRS